MQHAIDPKIDCVFKALLGYAAGVEKEYDLSSHAVTTGNKRNFDVDTF
jgi:hypothetical protein